MKLHRIIQWVDANGAPKSVDRLNLSLGMLCVKERIVFRKVDASTEASQELIRAAADAASKIVGKQCPIR